MRLSKEKLQKITLLARHSNPSVEISHDKSLFFPQKILWMSRPESRRNSLEKRSKSKDKIGIQNKKLRINELENKSKKEYKSIRSTMISRCASFELTRPATPKNILTKRSQPNKKLFKFHWKIGSGAFGRVWKVQQKKTKKMYAMKQICKATVILKKSVDSILNEKALLSLLNNPFLINMKCAFQDSQNLYIVLDYLSGGDLRYHLFTKVNFTQQQIKFITACIVLSLQYLRDNNIIHRDLKPENLVFESSGYLRLTDFGVARTMKPNNSKQTSGTPGYMAPQVLCHMNHSFEVDYYALGIMIYQMVMKKRPYMGQSRKQIRQMILAKQVIIRKQQLPSGFSQDIIDFINRLICRNKDRRLGQKSFNQIKRHPWLSSINWSHLRKKQLRPPFIPEHTCEKRDYLEQLDTQQADPQIQQIKLLLRNPQVQKLFSKYDYKKQNVGVQNLNEILRRL